MKTIIQHTPISVDDISVNLKDFINEGNKMQIMAEFYVKGELFPITFLPTKDGVVLSPEGIKEQAVFVFDYIIGYHSKAVFSNYYALTNKQLAAFETFAKWRK